MSEDIEWGPWIEHNQTLDRPRGVNVGDFVHIVHIFWGHSVGYVTEQSQWRQVIRYRIRKPRALIELRQMVENLPAPERVKELT